MVAADPSRPASCSSSNDHTVETEQAFTHGSIDEFAKFRYFKAETGARKAAELCRRTRLTRLRVLEVGCGTAGLYEPFAAAGHSYVGIDIDERMVAAAERRGVPARVADLYDFEEMPFDAVLFSQVLEHSREPGIFLDHVRRLLNLGGLAVCDVPHHGSLAGRLSRLPGLAKKNRFGAIELPHHSYAYTEAPLLRLFAPRFSNVEVFTTTSLDPVWGQGIAPTSAVRAYHRTAAAIGRPSLVVAVGRR